MARFRVLEGAERGRIYPLDGERHVLGREAEDVPILDQGISRQHAAVVRMGELHMLKDLGSRNGTFVNDERVDEWVLRAGDRVQVGHTVLGFEDRFGAGDATESDIRYADTDGATHTIDRGHHRLRVLYRVSRILGTGESFEETMLKIARSMAVALEADHVYLFSFEADVDHEFPCIAGFDRTPVETLSVSSTILRQVRDEQRPILSSDATLDSRFSASKSVVAQRVRSLLCVPLTVMNQPIGAFYASNSKLTEVFDVEDLELATMIGMLVGNSLEMWRLMEAQGSLYRRVLELLADVSESRTPEFRGRPQRVANYSAAIARVLGYDDPATQQLWIAGLLHDIGTLGLTEEELHAVNLDQRKAKKAVELLDRLPELEEVRDAIVLHTERLDGSGFPNGLSGADVPEVAQIVGLACQLDDLLTRGGESGQELETRQAVRRVREECSSHFSKPVIEALEIAYRLNRLFEEDRMIFRLDLLSLVRPPAAEDDDA
ncbi:MAG: HD domain-containing phosphohydrolase [Planctomycetota bacterium]